MEIEGKGAASFGRRGSCGVKLEIESVALCCCWLLWHVGHGSVVSTLCSNDSMSCGVGGGGGSSGDGGGGDERKSLEINCEKSIVGASSAIFHATAGIQLKSNRLGNGKRVGALPTQNAAALRRGEIPNLNI
ncbi:hypothetical protein HZH66_014241 [Vespula vulgaris]|uniref:Uncharacterized protein n=1 Tax=Vespula vulgaris TaxID=7454 RepID=A0A834MQ11_VESVU|nr:hypothetical protein HZH66_014241 [Vespula vulgaris]